MEIATTNLARVPRAGKTLQGIGSARVTVVVGLGLTPKSGQGGCLVRRPVGPSGRPVGPGGVRTVVG